MDLLGGAVAQLPVPQSAPPGRQCPAWIRDREATDGEPADLNGMHWKPGRTALRCRFPAPLRCVPYGYSLARACRWQTWFGQTQGWLAVWVDRRRCEL